MSPGLCYVWVNGSDLLYKISRSDLNSALDYMYLVLIKGMNDLACLTVTMELYLSRLTVKLEYFDCSVLG